MHSGIGPFDIRSGSVMGYGKANYSKGGLRAGFFTNILNGDADHLLTVDLNGAPITFDFETKTYDFEVSNVQTLGKRHVLSYGGNLRFNYFDLSIAPERRRPHRVRRLRAGRDLPVRACSAGSSAAASTASTTSTTSCSRRGRRS